MAAINEAGAKRILGDAPDDKQFYCSDGRVLKNLMELGSALIGMSEETFGYHSNATKTDFSNWIKDVIGDEKLATDLVGVSRISAARAVADRIVYLRGRIPASRRPKA